MERKKEKWQDPCPQTGYILLKGALSAEQIEYGRSAILDKNTVDYEKIKKYIEGIVLPRVNNTFPGWDCTYLKYRVSDNNNSDASTFHRDVICYDQQEKKSFPVFTCLTYLDRTVMEVIEESHEKHTMSFGESVSNFKNQKKRIAMVPGDILLFRATLLHRGIFTERLPHRRLVQIFEVYPTQAVMEEFAPQILHVPSHQSSGSGAFLLKLSRISWIIGIINAIMYLNAATGYGFQKNALRKSKLDESLYKYISSEGTQPRINVHRSPFLEAPPATTTQRKDLASSSQVEKNNNFSLKENTDMTFDPTFFNSSFPFSKSSFESTPKEKEKEPTTKLDEPVNKINQYVFNPKIKSKQRPDVPVESKPTLVYYTYTQKVVLYSLLAFLILVLIVFGAVMLGMAGKKYFLNRKTPKK